MIETVIDTTPSPARHRRIYERVPGGFPTTSPSVEDMFMIYRNRLGRPNCTAPDFLRFINLSMGQRWPVLAMETACANAEAALAQRRAELRRLKGEG